MAINSGATAAPLPGWDGTTHNFVFLGEAGCGKSEIAVNLAFRLAEMNEKPVHFFDMDMTKPLFRSREMAGPLEERGITVHFEKQFYDAPVTVGGAELLLRRDDNFSVLDVGGDYIGARSVGQYAPIFLRPSTAVYYIINPYRPWSGTIERIDRILSGILSVTHLSIDRFHLVGNPNLGEETTAESWLEGHRMLTETVGPYRELEFYCAEEAIAGQVAGRIEEPVMPLRLYFRYPWNM